MVMEFHDCGYRLVLSIALSALVIRHFPEGMIPFIDVVLGII